MRWMELTIYVKNLERIFAISFRILYDLAELPDIAELRGILSNPKAGTQRNCDWQTTLLVDSVLFRCNRWAWNYFKCIGSITIRKKRVGNKIGIFPLPAHLEIKLLHRTRKKSTKSLFSNVATKGLFISTWLPRSRPTNEWFSKSNELRSERDPASVAEIRFLQTEISRSATGSEHFSPVTDANETTMYFRCRTGCKIPNFYLSGSYSPFNSHKIISIEK